MSVNRLLIPTSMITLACIVLSATFFLYPLSQERTADEIILMSINAELTDATTAYVQNAISIAEYRGSRLIIVSLNTPGGYVSSVEAMMSLMDESKIPMVVFVEDRAVSGGTYALMASHIAVMKSGSQIGSCQPVDVYGEPITDSKYINYLTELMRNHAWLHSRNETSAQLFVKENLNLNGEQAHRFEVVDLIADDPQDMLAKLTSYSLIKYKDGETKRFKLATKGEMNRYQVIQSWDFENITEATSREYRSTVEFLSPLSTLFEFPYVLGFPALLLLPYIYPILVVPILSSTVSLSLETIIAVVFGISGIVGIAGIVLLLQKKESPSKIPMNSD